MKICSSCKESKPLDSFAIHRQTSDGFQKMCKMCQKAYREVLKSKPKPVFDRLTCFRCSITKSVDEFPKVGSSSTGYGSWCISCRHSYQKDYDYIDKSRSRRHDRVQWFRSIKSGKPCTDCGKTLEPACMDYDHISSDKEDHVSRMVLENVPKNKILSEISKCEIVCVICHNRRTQKRFGFGDRKYPPHIQRNIDIINKAKSVPCSYCGQQYEPFNMQFDHVDAATKIANVSQLKSAKISKLMAEISKCNILCAVCHRRKSLMEQKGGIYPKSRVKVVTKTFIDLEAKKKQCTRCKEVLEFAAFRFNKKTKSGLDSWCQACVNAAKREARKINMKNPT